MAISEVNHGPPDDVPSFVDNEPEAPIFIKERQPITPGIVVDAALAETRDLPRAHKDLNERRLDAQAFPKECCVNAEGIRLKLNNGHRQDASALHNVQCLSISPI